NTTTEEYEYGQTPAFKGSIDKAADAQYTYTFKGWDKEIVAVTGPATYTAEYDSVVNKYTITFVDYNGTEIKKETLDYGAAIVAPADPTRAATLTTIYTFKGWTPEVAETVTADATYTATYTETLRNQNEDVTIEKNPEDGSIDVDADAKDPDGDGKEEVEIPMDGIYEEWENGFDKPINIIVNFGESFFLKVDILPEDQAEIYKTLKGLIESQSLTSKDVKLVISREIVQLDGKTTTVYGLSFKVGNALVSMAGKGANTVTVNMPLTDGTTAEFDVYVMNTDGTYEKLESEMTDGAEGYANVTFSVPYYTSIRVMDMTVSAVTEMPTEEPSGCDGSNAWWIILLVVVLLVVLGLIGYILYQRGVFDKWLASDEAKETEAETEPETEETSNAAPLFIPLGEELPDDEPEEIHIVREVSVEEVDELMSDSTAEHVLEESERVGGVGRLGIINIGVLHDTFEEGDTVNLDILKDKDMIADSIGRLKVLASGSLDKALTVEADAFSVQAIKMITLTGGHAIKLRPADQSSQNQKNQKK
ncbi:MAG: hypothetical protein E7645_05470, partial [Ruminococcaceae bacterium]|nr:hypothetical protein [Oscillospiraceae bacterium]